MRKKIKRTAVVVAGVLFVLLGLIGLALPFLQGFLFLTIGIILLSLSSPRIHAWLETHTQRYPKIHAGVEKLRKWVERVVGPVE